MTLAAGATYLGADFGWIEGSTILAILSGTLMGAVLANYSVQLALLAEALVPMLEARGLGARVRRRLRF